MARAQEARFKLAHWAESDLMQINLLRRRIEVLEKSR